MKRTLALMLALLTVIGLLAGCAKDPVDTPNTGDSTGSQTPSTGTNTGSNTGTTEPTPTPTPDPVKPEEPWTYYFVRTGEESGLNSHSSNGTNQYIVNDRCAGMMYYYIPGDDGKSAKIVPIFAESEPSSADGVNWTIKLRKDVKWADGDPLTADDWIYSWKMSMDPKLYYGTGSQTASNYITVKNAMAYYNSASNPTDVKWEDVGIKKVDDYTITIVTDGTYTAVDVMRHLYLRNTGLVKEEIYQKCISADGTNCEYGTALDKVAFAGQFYVDSWVKGAEIIFKKNENWPLADLISIDTMVSRVVTDESTRLELFEQGQADSIDLGTNGLAKYGEDPRILSYSNKKIQGIEFNMNHKDATLNSILNDSDFRKGIFWAIDRVAVAKLTNCLASPYFLSYQGEIKADGTLYRNLPEAEALVEKYAPNNGYDVEKAKALVDAVLTKNNVDKITLRLNYSESDEHLRKASEYIDSQFDTIFGGKVDLKPAAVSDRAAVMRSCWKEGPVDTWELSWGNWGLAAENFMPWKKFEKYTSTNSTRYSAYKNTKLDEIYAQTLLDENRLNEQKMIELTLAGEEAWYEDMTCVPVLTEVANLLYQEHIQLPLTQYTAQIGYGWMYATKK